MTLADVMKRGVHLKRYEALAIAQELIAHGDGAPTVENIQLNEDGTVAFLDAGGRVPLADVGRLLQTLLPPEEVPTPLRHTLARAVGEEDEAGPFESLEAFSEALAPFEAGDRHGIVRALLQRLPPPPRPRWLSRGGDRRRRRDPRTPAVHPAAHAAPPPLTASPSPSPSPLPAPAPTPTPTPTPTVVPRVSLDTPSEPDAVPVRRRFPIRQAVLTVLVGSLMVAAFAGGYTKVRRSLRPADVPITAPPVPATGQGQGQPTPGAAEQAVPTSGSAAAVPPAGVPDAPLVTAGAMRELDWVIKGPSDAAFSPAFAANGSAVFFHTGTARAATSAIAMTRADSSSGDRQMFTVVANGARNYHPRPSPDGKLIAFDSDKDGERAVYVANADGTAVRRVSAGGYAAAPTWSPDGKRLAYIRGESANPKVWNLWVQPLGGHEATRVTAYGQGQTWSASWFPDNRRICYTHENKLVVKDLSTGEAKEFASPVPGHAVRTPAVSPDGSQVVFQVFRNGAWVLDLASGATKQILSDPVAEEFAWSPTGDRIAFHSRRGGQWGIYFLGRG